MTQTRERSAIVSTVVDGSTEVPTDTPRSTTTPPRGARMVTRRLGSPVCSIASMSSGVMPSTVRRVRPPAITALASPDAAVSRRAARYSVCEARSSCEKTPARGWPACTSSPVVLTCSSSIQPATRVCTCEMRDSSGTTVATARTCCVSASRPTTSRRTPSASSVSVVTSIATRSGASVPATGIGAGSPCDAMTPGPDVNGHLPRVCWIHSTPVNNRAVLIAPTSGARSCLNMDVEVMERSPRTIQWRARGAPTPAPVRCPP